MSANRLLGFALQSYNLFFIHANIYKKISESLMERLTL